MTRLQAGQPRNQGSVLGSGKRFFSGSHPAPSPKGMEVKCVGREADHSPPWSAKLKNVWSCSSILPYIFMAWCLVKHRKIFTCILQIYYHYSSSVQVQQPCVGLGLLCGPPVFSGGFITVSFSAVGSLVPPPWGMKEYTLSGPYPFSCLTWVALPEAKAPTSIALQVIGARRPLHYKAIDLKKDRSIFREGICLFK